jgi:hypothetical protein
MFRGGKVIDSRGTGITSGLMDGGRVGYSTGDIVLGGDLYKDTDYSDFIKTNFPEGRKTKGFAPALLNQMFDSEGNLKEEFTYQNIFGQAKGEKGKDAVSVYDTDLLSFADTGLIPGNKSKRITSKRPLANLLKEDVTETLKASEAYDTASVPRGPQELGMTTREQPKDPPDPNDPNNNNEQVTEVDAKTLMRENAELFKELLGADNEKKLKDARIGDVSDYLLKFFEGSQQEGATVGSSAANVARFATAKPSKTELAKQAIDKSDQTAMALAINDYIAGKRSKEQIDLMEKKLGANFAQQIALIDYKNKKDTFVDLVGELGKGMSNARAIASAVQKAFGKVPISLNEKQSEANLADKENIGKYFILSDGTVKTVIENVDGKIIEDIVYSPSGITIES